MKYNSRLGKIGVWLAWVVIWQVMAIIINQDIFLPSPVVVTNSLLELLGQLVFWRSIAFTVTHIVVGFLCGTITALLLATCASRWKLIEWLLEPFMITVKSVPVASFIVLVLIWFSARNLSVFISFLMVLPIIYANTLQGIRNVDEQLIEMAKLFRMPFGIQVRYVYGPQVFHYIQSAISVAIGLSFKAGIAAEVIGSPTHSIGEHIFQAKVYLNTSDLFAWTVVVILLSLLFERAIYYLLLLWNKKYCKCVGVRR